MAKKHRVKRQKLVAHLLLQEKQRDAYLAKRRAPKRSREMRNNEEVMGEGQDRMESTAFKKRRTENAARDADVSDEEVGQHTSPPPPQQQQQKSAAASQTAEKKSGAFSFGPASGEAEKKAFFPNTPFSELVKAAPAASEAKASADAAPVKKSLKRRLY